jgi:hypothetical protein
MPTMAAALYKVACYSLFVGQVHPNLSVRRSLTLVKVKCACVGLIVHGLCMLYLYAAFNFYFWVGWA